MKNYQALVLRFMRLGALIFLTASFCRGGTISYTYDSAGRLVLADYGAGKTTSYAYDVAGNLLESSSPAPAITAGPIQNNQLMISWPAVPNGFILERASNLTSPISWTPVGGSPTLVGNQYVQTISVGNGPQFYRLRKP